jgi:hypothetical protein
MLLASRRNSSSAASISSTGAQPQSVSSHSWCGAAESICIAYVAVTRARDLLVAPVSGDEPVEGWLSVLNPVLYPPANSKGRAEDDARVPEVR